MCLYIFNPEDKSDLRVTGVRFADMTIKRALADILTKYEVTLCPHSVDPIPLHPRVLTLKPANTLPLKLSPIANLEQKVKQELAKFPPTEDERIAEHHLKLIKTSSLA